MKRRLMKVKGFRAFKFKAGTTHNLTEQTVKPTARTVSSTCAGLTVSVRKTARIVANGLIETVSARESTEVIKQKGNLIMLLL